MINSLQFAFPKDGKSAVFQPEMSSLPSEKDEEDFISGAVHIKFKGEDTADHVLSEPESFIEESVRRAVSQSAYDSLRAFSFPMTACRPQLESTRV